MSEKVTEILENEKQGISLEVFPPKKDGNFDKVKEATLEIAELKPAFMSVTYGAGGGTSKYTIDIAKSISRDEGVPTVEHLTCVSSSKEDIKKKISEIHDAGIKNIMALRGDLTPELEASDRSSWDYRHASELVRDIRESGYDFCIGGACYPEVHPESRNSDEDIAHLKEKVDAGVDFLVTQMVFDNGLFYSFLNRVRDAGIDVPVIPGIMPITNVKQVERARAMSGGSYMPRMFMSLVDKFGDDPDTMKQAGIIYASSQIMDLFANGIKHVHVYTMNKPDVAEKIMANMESIIR